MGDLHHIGYRFYTDRIAPRDWVYEDYLAEIDALASARVARGLRDDYYRLTRERFAEARARAIWGMPEPPPPPSTKGLEALRAVRLKFARMNLVDLLVVRQVQLQHQRPEDDGPPPVQYGKAPKAGPARPRRQVPAEPWWWD